jgi:NRAMP (natural resistance-associated macrophage protein)-like metal ion transporter
MFPRRQVSTVAPPAQKKAGVLRRLLSSLGPGLVAGAADDDPSGIATYSMAGAQFGFAMLWTALITWPLMAAVQMTCARIGMVTGRGLAFGLKKKFPKPLVLTAAVALLAANTINVAADLAGMADAMEMLTNVSSHLWVIVFAIGISWATVRLRYAHIANVLKWLALSLFAYVATAFIVHPPWGAIARATFIPKLPHGHGEWQMLVAILGTTISPYLFFWQASQEVEEEKAGGQLTIAQRRGATEAEIVNRKLDVGTGTFFSNLVMFFIIAATAATLHASGITKIETSRQAAEALRPLAGAACTFLYTIGIIGVGLLAIPTLTGSAAYAFAEVYGWKQGLDEKIGKARSFYGVVLLSTIAAIIMNFSHMNPVSALYWTAVINGVLAPFLLVGILFVATDRKLMVGQPSSLLARASVTVTAVLMFAAVFVMFLV